MFELWLWVRRYQSFAAYVGITCLWVICMALMLWLEVTDRIVDATAWIYAHGIDDVRLQALEHIVIWPLAWLYFPAVFTEGWVAWKLWSGKAVPLGTLCYATVPVKPGDASVIHLSSPGRLLLARANATSAAEWRATLMRDMNGLAWGCLSAAITPIPARFEASPMFDGALPKRLLASGWRPVPIPPRDQASRRVGWCIGYVPLFWQMLALTGRVQRPRRRLAPSVYHSP